MRAFTRWLLLLSAVCAASASAAPASREPQIGYLFPAGGRQGSVVEILAGGQRLRGANRVYVSGEGVHASVIQHYRPPRNLQPEQRAELVRLLKELKEKRLAKLPRNARYSNLRLPGERYVPKGKGKANAAKKKQGQEKKAKNKGGEPAKKDPATLPPHPLLRDLESKGLRALYHVAAEFFDYRRRLRSQPNAQLAEMVLIRVTIDRGATPGDRELRLGTPLGLTNPMCFQVGLLPEVREQEPNDPRTYDPLPKEPTLDLPVLLNGQIMPGDVDRFRFRAKQGQRLVVQTHARRLVPFLADAVPGWFQATVALYDAKGREVAFADDYRFHPDPVLFYRVPADGEYELEIRDSIYRGRDDFVYRIALGELPFITQVFPLGGRAGVDTVAAIDGWNLPLKRLRLDTQPGGPPIRHTALLHNASVTAPLPYAVDTLPECSDTEPNNDTPTAQRIVLPRIINGRIERPGDIDVFQFHGRAGDHVVADVQARRLHSPLDSLLRLTDASGQVLAWNDDHVLKDGHLHPDMGLLTHHADSCLRARLPKDGVYYLHLADTRRHGSKAHAYRLRIGAPQPDFELRVTPSSLSVSAGRVVPITVHALRKDGFQGEIKLMLKDAPPGFALSGGWIPGGRDRVRMTLTVPRKRPSQPVALHLEGRAQVGATTLRRPATPSDDVMQAFLYRHLAPAQQLMVAVTKARWFPPLPVPASRRPIRIPAGGTALVLLRAPRDAARRLHLALSEPPDGVAIHDVKPVARGLSFELKLQGEAAKAGFGDNLIVEAFADFQVRSKGNKGGKAAKQTRRVSLGTLPAIPFVVVQP